MAIKFYERTPEQQALLGYLAYPSQSEEHGGEAPAEGTNNGVADVIREPHGSVGARAGRRAIAQGAGTEISDALFRYSAPEEVEICPVGICNIILPVTSFYFIFHLCLQVMTFPSTCGTCAVSCETRMFVTSILILLILKS